MRHFHAVNWENERMDDLGPAFGDGAVHQVVNQLNHAQEGAGNERNYHVLECSKAECTDEQEGD